LKGIIGVDEYKTKDLKRKVRQAKAIEKKANRNGKNVSGRDLVSLNRLRGKIRKDLTQEEDD